nr:MAG TPA: hypothetical protein [Caudoviricetes sp.]
MRVLAAYSLHTALMVATAHHAFSSVRTSFSPCQH